MKAEVAYVNDGDAVREAARLYNVPVETLRRRVITVLTGRLFSSICHGNGRQRFWTSA